MAATLVGSTAGAAGTTDAAELLFDAIMAEPSARRIDRVRGVEASPVSFRDAEPGIVPASVVPHFAGWPPIFTAIWF